MVAPNSPSARAKHSTMPAMMPGSASGSVTVRNTQAALAPSVAAASSSRRSIASIDSRIGAHHQRKAHDAAGERRAGPAEREHDAEMIVEKRADRPLAAERDQQQIAGDDRRQHQRQMHEPVEQRLAPEILARQQPARSRCRTAARHRRDERDPQRQADAVHSRRSRACTGSEAASRVTGIVKQRRCVSMRRAHDVGLIRTR